MEGEEIGQEELHWFVEEKPEVFRPIYCYSLRKLEVEVEWMAGILRKSLFR